MLCLSLNSLRSLTELPSERLKKVPKFIQMLQSNPKLPSLRLKHLASVDLYSARIDDRYRAILMQRGTDYVLLQAGKHDDAYHWAEQGGGSFGSVELPVEPNGPSKPAPVDSTDPIAREETGTPEEAGAAKTWSDSIEIGTIHTWSELAHQLAWETDKRSFFLPEKEGRIVCACLRSDLNPSAPWEILVGTSHSLIRKANMLIEQRSPIPVFTKLAVDQWEYWGKFQFESCEKDPIRMRPRLPPNRLEDTAMILFLRDA